MPYGWGNRSPHWGMNSEVHAVCQRTGNARLRSYFTSSGWFNIGAILAERKFNVAEIECILRSELMQSVIDSATKMWGTYNSADFERALGAATADPETFRGAASNQMLDEIEAIQRKQQEDK